MGDAAGRGGALPVELLAALLEGGHHLLDHLVEEHGGELVVQWGAEAEFDLELEPAGAGVRAALEGPVALELFEEGGVDGLHRDGPGPRHPGVGHLRAIAPTVSNSKLSGNVSAGIEPWAANVFTEQTAKGTFIRKNPTLEKALDKIGHNTKEVWDQILADGGSVQGLEFMDNYRVKLGEKSNPITINKFAKLPEVEQGNYIPLKDVYLTFKELNQLELVRQAGIRQQYIDQSVSLNLAFPTEAEPKFINQVHLEAYQAGVKTLYYMRTESVLRGDIAARATQDCLACDG
jgi:hypothetical protein